MTDRYGRLGNDAFFTSSDHTYVNTGFKSFNRNGIKNIRESLSDSIFWYFFTDYDWTINIPKTSINVGVIYYNVIFRQYSM